MHCLSVLWNTLVVVSFYYAFHQPKQHQNGQKPRPWMSENNSIKDKIWNVCLPITKHNIPCGRLLLKSPPFHLYIIHITTNETPSADRTQTPHNSSNRTRTFRRQSLKTNPRDGKNSLAAVTTPPTQLSYGEWLKPSTGEPLEQITVKQSTSTVNQNLQRLMLPMPLISSSHRMRRNLSSRVTLQRPSGAAITAKHLALTILLFFICSILARRLCRISPACSTTLWHTAITLPLSNQERTPPRPSHSDPSRFSAQLPNPWKRSSCRIWQLICC